MPRVADRQHRRDAREHFARRLVGEGNGKDAVRVTFPVLDQPGDPRGENARLPRAGSGENQRRLVGKGDRGELLRIEVFEERHRAGAKGVILLQRPRGRAGQGSGPDFVLVRPEPGVPLERLGHGLGVFLRRENRTAARRTPACPGLFGMISAGYPRCADPCRDHIAGRHPFT